jgi:hypothetical protein
MRGMWMEITSYGGGVPEPFASRERRRGR